MTMAKDKMNAWTKKERAHTRWANKHQNLGGLSTKREDICAKELLAAHKKGPWKGSTIKGVGNIRTLIHPSGARMVLDILALWEAIHGQE